MEDTAPHELVEEALQKRKLHRAILLNVWLQRRFRARHESDTKRRGIRRGVGAQEARAKDREQLTAQVPPASTHPTLYAKAVSYSLRPVTNVGDCIGSNGLVYFPVARHVVGRGYWDDVAEA